MNNTQFTRKKLRAGTALQALALIGAGAGLSAVAIAPAAAQDYTNVTAGGRVVGPNGPIAGATVTITSDAQGFTRSTSTDGSGTFRIPQLPAGVYTFEVSAPGYATFREDAVRLDQTGATNQFNLALAGTSADAGGEIVVRGTRVAVADFERTTTGAVINIGELANRVPVARDLTSVVQLAPATTLGDSAFGNLPNISGSSVAENAYFVNGLNITEFREGLGSVSVPFEFYESVEVKNGGFPAEFGRTTGGVVNAITKSGSNEFHAGVLVNWEPEFLEAADKDTVFSENSRETSDRINSTFYVSGPIIRDRLFAYVLYETRNVTSTNTVATAVPNASGGFDRVGSRIDYTSTSSPFYAVKIDAIPFDGQRLELTYFNTEGTSYRDSYGYTDFGSGRGNGALGGGTGAFAGNEVTQYGGSNYVVRYTGSFTDFLTVSAAYGKNNNRNIVGSNNDAYPTIIENRFGSPTNIGNPTNVINSDNDEREFYRADVDLYFNLFGTHHIKFGYDREDLVTDSTSSYTGNVAYNYFNSGPAGDSTVSTPNTNYVAARTFVNGGAFPSRNEAYYIQDSWSLFGDRLTLQFGARNDRFENKNALGQTFYKSGDNWAPRVGFSADPFGDGRTKIYGSYGRYFLPIAANTNIRLAGGDLDFTRYNVLNGLNANNTPIIGAPITTIPNARPCPDTGTVNCNINQDGQPVSTEATVAKNLQAQAVDEFIIGAERRLGDGWSVGLYYTHRELVRALEDAAIDAAVNQYCVDNGIATYAQCSAVFSGFHQYVLINPGSDATITLSDPLPGETSVRTIDFTADQLGYPKATRDYDAITATFERAFDGVWSLQGSYTWSRLYGNYEGAVKSDNGQTDAGLTTDFDQPGLTNGTTGLSPNHRRHNFKIFGSYQLADWLTVGGNFTALSPRKFGCIGRIPASVDPFAQFYGAAGFYCNVDAAGNVITNPATGAQVNTTGALTPRGSQFESDWRTQTNLSFVVKMPTEIFQSDIRLDVFNIFNERNALDFEERGTLNNGTPRNTYREATSYQGPRAVRLQLAIRY